MVTSGKCNTSHVHLGHNRSFSGTVLTKNERVDPLSSSSSSISFGILRPPRLGALALPHNGTVSQRDQVIQV